ncbi:unnamed protein product [Zymoseptoria tritici ST99CH_1A5]|uniref:Uncharacterized protein n=2 Tax=Zymoseptoria tritici TaxID=1047171 RepID=A0A2H1GQ59_ZYMTR|nr:unnamed protein product [Zymoseptoria tritici ST99CH_1E4]SMY26534.1 unnamed protein product [Zymoseptoria tritici ST99CH_1A5]
MDEQTIRLLAILPLEIIHKIYNDLSIPASLSFVVTHHSPNNRAVRLHCTNINEWAAQLSMLSAFPALASMARDDAAILPKLPAQDHQITIRINQQPAARISTPSTTLSAANLSDEAILDFLLSRFSLIVIEGLCLQGGMALQLTYTYTLSPSGLWALHPKLAPRPNMSVDLPLRGVLALVDKAVRSELGSVFNGEVGMAAIEHAGGKFSEVLEKAVVDQIEWEKDVAEKEKQWMKERCEFMDRILVEEEEERELGARLARMCRRGRQRVVRGLERVGLGVYFCLGGRFEVGC